MLHTFNQKLRKVTVYSVLLMVLTSIHHVWGAIIYHTPWRLHVLLLSIPVASLTLLLGYFCSKTTPPKWIFLCYCLITLLASILLIGVFEGIYNHILKNCFFFAGLSIDVMKKLYPEGTYEMPDNLIFELTGVLQGVVAIPLIRYFIQLLRSAALTADIAKHN